MPDLSRGPGVDTSDARLSDARTPTAHAHAASEVTSGAFAAARLGSGSASSTKVLRGDGSWASAVQGAQTAPAVPTSAQAFTNPFGFACLVTVRGGTVSAVAVAGNALGLIAGTVLVPAGGTITLTYAVAPAWDWFGLG